MFNTRGLRNIALTFQSTPPFLVENIVAIVLTILMAVPFIFRIHRFLENRNNNRALTTIRELNHQFQYHGQYRLIRAVNSTPNLHQSECWVTKSKNEMHPKDGHTDSDSDKSVDEFDIYDYDYYRYKLISKKLTEQYGFQQPPEDIIFNSLHLNSVDSNTKIRLNERYGHHFLDCMDEYYRKKDKNLNNRVRLIHPRDYFLTRTINNKPNTFDKAIDTTISIIEVDQLSEMITPKKRLKTSFGVPQKQKGLQAKPDNKFNKFLNENETLKKEINFESNSRPSSPLNGTNKISDESAVFEKILKIKEPLKKNPSTQSNAFVFSKSTKKASRLRKSCELTNIQDKTECKNISNKLKEEQNDEKNLTQNRGINEDKIEVKTNDNKVQLIETNKFQDNTESIKNINKVSTITVLPEEEKLLSNITSDIFDSSNSYLSRSQSQRPRPSSGGIESRAFKYSMPKVNSRPRSSEGNYAWEVPDDSGKIWSVENSNGPKPSSTTRPKSANPAISRKKSVATIPVLESIIDLTCNATIDTQDSFITMGVDEIKQRLTNSELPLELKHSIHCFEDDRNSSKSINKSKMSGQISVTSKKKPMSKISNSFETNQSLISGQKKSYLQARSGKYSSLHITSMQKKKQNY